MHAFVHREHEVRYPHTRKLYEAGQYLRSSLIAGSHNGSNMISLIENMYT